MISLHLISGLFTSIPKLSLLHRHLPSLTFVVTASSQRNSRNMSSSETQTSSSSSAETSFEESVPVQPMHQGNIRKPWAKKILQEYSLSTVDGLTSRGNYASPTDNLMSPCTKKLQAHKKRHYNKYIPAPRTLLTVDQSLNSSLARTK